MHDAKGRELKEGDTILIPMKVRSVSPGADYCNVSAESCYTRRPDGLREYFSGNTDAVLRANPGDDNGPDDFSYRDK